jgi:hypothetical protein
MSSILVFHIACKFKSSQLCQYNILLCHFLAVAAITRTVPQARILAD